MSGPEGSTTDSFALTASGEFRVLDLGPDGKLHPSRDEAALGPPGPGGFRWIDLLPSRERLELLRGPFELHPLAIEDCLHFDQRPKLEEYSEHLFVVTLGFTSPAARAEELVLHELHAFIGNGWLITVHNDEIDVLDRVWRRVLLNPPTTERGADFIYYLIADALVDAIFAVLDQIADELDVLEDEVLERPRRLHLHRIVTLKRQLVRLRKVLAPQRDTMNLLVRHDYPTVAEANRPYFRDVYDHLLRINESIEANRDLLGNTLDAYLSKSANQTNEIMKSLTLVSAVFLPLSFVVGFFGQNFRHLPGLQDWTSSLEVAIFMLVVCFGTPIAMVVWFRRKGWF